MRIITDKTELSEFFRDELLPYYEQHYREDLTMVDAERLNLEGGLCWCAKRQFNVNIDGIMDKMTGNDVFLFPEIMYNGYTAKESILPRIEWMRKFIKENLPYEKQTIKHHE